MATKVHMEALSPTMEEGRLVKWTKHEGDQVKSGDTLAEVETDKAVMELVARADGSLIKIVVPEGQTVPVGNVVGYIGAAGEKVDGAGTGTGTGAGSGKRETGNVAPAAPSAPAPAPKAPSEAVERLPAAGPTVTDRIKASPLARKIAQDSGVDLRSVVGSGPGGRVIKKDVEGGRQPGAVRSVSAAASVPGSVRLPAAGAPYEDVPLTQIRKTIAKRL
ncbi:MAG TPA: biotin/lipoyl-containing protein, partial [Gemmatimonadales bacterium]